MNGVGYRWTLLWPGLSRLWLRGDGLSLAVAILFAVIVNTLLLSTFVWPAFFGSLAQTTFVNSVGWLTVLCLWSVSVVTTGKLLPRWLPGADTHGDDRLLQRAQTAYLQGNWYDAEKHLIELLEQSPRDADAHLMLAALYRRTRRHDEAQRHLDLLERINGGGKWLFEIDQERRLLAQTQDQAEDDDSDDR
jgi:tetratricopeptide (TPR) repeat protein